VGDGLCRITFVRYFIIQSAENAVCTDRFGFASLTSIGEHVYALEPNMIPPGGVIVRYSTDGSRTRWLVPFAPYNVAQDRHGSAYVLGSTGTRLYNQHYLARLERDGTVDMHRLPIDEAGGMAVDARGRIWFTVPTIHSLVVLSPTPR
jgi:sugar lactone lactonase YvrE